MPDFFSKKNVLITSTILTLILSGLLWSANVTLSENGGYGYVSLQFTFTLSRFLHIATTWGEMGQSFFLKTIWLDYLYPLAYAALFSGLLAKWGGHRKFFFALPWMSAGLDFFENSLHALAIAGLPDQPSAVIIFAGSLAAFIKWCGIAIVLATLVFTLCKKNFRF